jgi:argininosuccinate lyase
VGIEKEAEQLRGRFAGELDESASRYVASAAFDRRLYRHDIAGSIAHSRMLARQGIISEKEAEQITSGLKKLLGDINSGRVQLRTDREDIHMNVESMLAERIGDVAGKLHTARSRNDQVALDLRLYVKEAVIETVSLLKKMQSALVDKAEEHKTAVMPGYTHLQRAQPVLFAHHMLAYFEMFQRDIERFWDCFKRADVLPLGSGALAGVSYPVDREWVAEELGFSLVSANSLDAVSDRDFVVEYESAAAIAMMHVSRLAEECVIWSSAEFGFVEIDDAFATGSSIMPQKKNADVAELARGKTGRVYGHLCGMLATMKSLPLSYNRDMQEDKEGLFDVVDTLQTTLNVVSGMVSTLKVNHSRMRTAAEGSYTLATDVADYLTRKGLPFRQAHMLVGRLVQYAAGKQKCLPELSLEEYRSFSPLFGDDIFRITVESSIAARAATGGTAPAQVDLQLTRARDVLSREGGK